jgi:type-F conjugative transfer system pilin assembly protein TrbC
MGIMKLKFVFVVFFTLYSSAKAEEYKNTIQAHQDITKTKEYQEYEAFANTLKKETNTKLEFKKDDSKNFNTKNITSIINSSIPNWRSLNTNTPSHNTAENKQNNKGTIPLIFISFSMPETLIQNYIKEAKLYNGVLVLRGLIDNSLKQTVLKLKEIEGIPNINKDGDKLKLSIIIHPHLFKLYEIKQVPAIVISKDNRGCILKYDDCDTMYEYDKIYGSITIQSLLTQNR